MSDIVGIILIQLLIALGLGGLLTVLILFIARDTTRIPTISNRLTNIETLLNSENSKDPDEVWKTSDGKYEAESFEELVIKMINDPEGPLTMEEINAFQSIFRKISGEANGDDDKPQF